MKVKLSVVMADEKYLSRFSGIAALQYADKIELSMFTQAEKAAEFIRKIRPDIVLAEKMYFDEIGFLSKISELVCFTEEKDVHTWRGFRAVCKYQKFSDIYKSVMDIYAESMEAEAIILKGDAESKKIVTFFSGAGGVGASTVAASYACYLADHGETVLYLNLEQTGMADLFFHAEGEDDFGRVLYSLEMATGSPAVRMENVLRRDLCGVYFYAACTSALDMLELNDDIMERLFEQLNVIKLFQWMIVDMDFSLEKKVYKQIERSYATYFVSDGTITANEKLKRKLSALEIVAEQREHLLLNRIFILYNRFGSKSGRKIQGSSFKEIGGINRFADADSKDLLKLISQTKVFGEMQF